MNSIPENEYNLTPDNKRMFDILVKAGWLENVSSHPGDPIKGLQWFVDKNEPSNSGYSRFLAFNTLYSELCRAGQITEDDLLMISTLHKHLNPN